MNKGRFSDQRLAQISSLKELRNTKQKINNRIEVLEDKFEHNRLAVFNIEGAMQGLASKVESVREAWERITEAARLGFRKIFVSSFSSLEGVEAAGIEVVKVADVPALCRTLFRN